MCTSRAGVTTEEYDETETRRSRALRETRRRLLAYASQGAVVMTDSLRPLTASAPPRLLEQLGADIRLRHYSPRTEDAYRSWVRRFILFHGKRHPRELGGAEVTTFLSDLARQGVSASTQNQALSALLFLYQAVLGVQLPWMRDIVRAQRPARLPTVLTRDEVRRLLAHMRGVTGLMAALMYGGGSGCSSV